MEILIDRVSGRRNSLDENEIVVEDFEKAVGLDRERDALVEDAGVDPGKAAVVEGTRDRENGGGNDAVEDSAREPPTRGFQIRLMAYLRCLLLHPLLK